MFHIFPTALPPFLGPWRYKDARSIIEGSELPVDERQVFHILPPINTEVDRIYDRQVEREFIYNAGNGTRAWIEEFQDEDGDVMRENSYRIHHTF